MRSYSGSEDAVIVQGLTFRHIESVGRTMSPRKTLVSVEGAAMWPIRFAYEVERKAWPKSDPPPEWEHERWTLADIFSHL